MSKPISFTGHLMTAANTILNPPNHTLSEKPLIRTAGKIARFVGRAVVGVVAFLPTAVVGSLWHGANAIYKGLKGKKNHDAATKTEAAQHMQCMLKDVASAALSWFIWMPEVGYSFFPTQITQIFNPDYKEGESLLEAARRVV